MSQLKSAKKKNYAVEIVIRLLREKPLGAVGAAIVLIFLIVGIFANVLAPHGYNDISLVARLQPPSLEHPFGTDNLGRDMLSRILYGARISMLVGLGAALLSTVISLIIGSISGFFGGVVDFIIQRFVDGVMCLPSLVILMTVIAVTGPGLVPVILILGVEGGISGRVRVVRSAVISIKRNLYIESAQAIGVSTFKTIWQHILPNIMAPVIVMFTMSMGTSIIMEATLSFLGLGVPPPMPSWGSMLSLSGRSYMLIAPWMALWPGLCLCVVVYGINMLGDALRDLLDPRLRGGLGSFSRKNNWIKKKVSAIGRNSTVKN